MIIKDKAIFIADAHYNRQRTELYKLLKLLQNETLFVNQIFLMGDMFDFLTLEIDYFKKTNSDIIMLINELSFKYEIIYLEGNHDYNLEKIFPSIDIISRENQPLYLKQDTYNIALAHGDIFTPWSYNFYTTIIRNHYFLEFINFLDSNNILSKYTEKKLMQKKICHKLNNFNKFICKRIKSYNSFLPTDLIIEGHFHQGYRGKKYINVPSLACGNQYMIYKNKQFSFNTL